MASAWDDDWETTADKQASSLSNPPPRSTAPEPKVSRAQRKLLHQEANRQLWQAADTPKDTPIFIQARNTHPPLATEVPVKQAVKVLARRPAPQKQPSQTAVHSNDGSKQSGVAGAPADDDDDPDSEEEERRRSAALFAERQQRAVREREEKQRKYAQVRERLFGASPQPGTGEPVSSSSSSQQAHGQSLSRPNSSGPGQGGARGSGGGRGRGGGGRGGREAGARLYEPEYAPRPDPSFAQRREGTRTPLQADAERPVRQPKGPDASGSGFASRGRIGVKGAATRGT